MSIRAFLNPLPPPTHTHPWGLALLRSVRSDGGQLGSLTRRKRAHVGTGHMGVRRARYPCKQGVGGNVTLGAL